MTGRCRFKLDFAGKKSLAIAIAPHGSKGYVLWAELSSWQCLLSCLRYEIAQALLSRILHRPLILWGTLSTTGQRVFHQRCIYQAIMICGMKWKMMIWFDRMIYTILPSVKETLCSLRALCTYKKHKRGPTFQLKRKEILPSSVRRGQP